MIKKALLVYQGEGKGTKNLHKYMNNKTLKDKTNTGEPDFEVEVIRAIEELLDTLDGGALERALTFIRSGRCPTCGKRRRGNYHE